VIGLLQRAIAATDSREIGISRNNSSARILIVVTVRIVGDALELFNEFAIGLCVLDKISSFGKSAADTLAKK